MTIPITNSPMIPGAQAAPAPASNTLDGDGFLTLLMAQLAHQDPTSPVETEQFMQQLTSLNTVQQLMEVNSTLGNVAAGISSLNNESAVQLVGKEVTAASNAFHKAEGETVTIEYDIPEDVESLTIRFTGPDGIEIEEALVLEDVDRGSHTVEWDGDVPEGDYTMSIQAKNADGDAVDVTTYTTGLVEEIRFDAGFPVLVIDGRHVALADIITVRPPPVADSKETP